MASHLKTFSCETHKTSDRNYLVNWYIIAFYLILLNFIVFICVCVCEQSIGCGARIVLRSPLRMRNEFYDPY